MRGVAHMKYFKLWWTIAIFFLFIVGCGDSDSGTNSGPSNLNLSKYDEVIYVDIIKLDESKRTITTSEKYYQDKCLVSEDKKLSYENILVDELIDNFVYSFNGDTLILTAAEEDDEEDPEEFSMLFTGGRNGKLHSVWRLQSTCSKKNGEVQCAKYEENYTEDIYFGTDQLVIMYNLIKPIEKEDDDEREIFDDYMNSYLLLQPLEDMFGHVGHAGYYPSSAVSNVAENVAKVLSDTSITVLSQTKTEMHISVKNREYTFKISNVKNDRQNHYEAADMSVSNGDFTCSIHMISADVTKELCVDENYKDMQTSLTIYDNGIKLLEADRYWVNNEHEFTQCLDSMKKIHQYGENYYIQQLQQ